MGECGLLHVGSVDFWGVNGTETWSFGTHDLVHIGRA
jgi:hypothetical protein